jgi:hypothetical protein
MRLYVVWERFTDEDWRMTYLGTDREAAATRLMNADWLCSMWCNYQVVTRVIR